MLPKFLLQQARLDIPLPAKRLLVMRRARTHSQRSEQAWAALNSKGHMTRESSERRPRVRGLPACAESHNKSSQHPLASQFLHLAVRRAKGSFLVRPMQPSLTPPVEGPVRIAASAPIACDELVVAVSGASDWPTPRPDTGGVDQTLANPPLRYAHNLAVPQRAASWQRAPLNTAPLAPPQQPLPRRHDYVGCECGTNATHA